MPYRTLEEWQNLLTEDLLKAASFETIDQIKARWRSVGQILCDFEALGYPDDNQWDEPLLLTFKGWVRHRELWFSHAVMLELNAIRDGDHYQRIGDLAVRLSAKLGLPKIHPGYAPYILYPDSRVVTFQPIQRLATWQTAEAHRAWLQKHTDGWWVSAVNLGVAPAWPLFQHFLQWGVEPWMAPTNAPELVGVPAELVGAPAKWQALAAEPTFLTWCYLQYAADTPVSVEAWRAWVSTLPPDHAAHTLDVSRAFQAYDLWASCQTSGQPAAWLALLRMLEPAPAQVPTENSPVADLTL